MPQPPSTNMGIILPTDHDDNDVWDVILDEALGIVVDRHDHTTGKGVKIPSAALNINADVSWSSSGTPRAITDLKAIDFFPTATSSVAALAGALFLDSGDSELYWRTTTGVNVKITAGAALNVAAFAGGIGGDYVVSGALVSYDDALDSYLFQQQGAPRPWARMRSGDVDIYETAASITNRVRLQSPAALAASYALTFPAALPGSTQLAQVSSTGAITASNTVANAATFSSAVTLTGGIANNVTLTLGATAAVNQSVTISGTGSYKHGTKSKMMHCIVGTTIPISGTAPASPGAGQSGVRLAASSVAYVQVPLTETHETLRTVICNTANVLSYTVSLTSVTAGGVVSSVATTGGSGSGIVTLTVTGGRQLAAGETLLMQVNAPGAPMDVFSVGITYDCV